jgi:hypothetical protein
MAQLKDTFSDSSLGSNSGGTGNGFAVNSQGGSTYESGGYATLTGSGYATMVIRSNDAINPYQDVATTTTWKFGTISYDASWQRFWVGYRLNGSNNDHFYPDNPNLQGLYIAIVSNTGAENNYAYKGNLVANSGGSRTILASWNWSDLNQLSGLVVKLTTTSTSYNLAFSGAAATPTYTFGSASGTLTGIGNLGNSYNVGVHNQASSGSTVLVDEIEVSKGVTTKAATAVTTAGATLNGVSFPDGLDTTAWFEYGTSATLSGATSTTAQSMGSGSSGVDYSQAISGLSANTTYYFRAVENSSSGTRLGSILSFITGPEIAVKQPAGTELTDGATSLSFASAEGVSGTARTFTITNTGGVALTGLSATVDGDFPGDYALSTLSTSTLEAGASTTLTVTFTAGALGTRNAVLHIASDDVDENPFDITLAGKGVSSVPGYVWSGNFPNYGYGRGGIWGSQFTAVDTCTLTHLGVYDHDQDGLSMEIPVGLWDVTTQQLIVSTTVSSGTGDPLFGSCRQHVLDTPVVLQAGKRYAVAALYPSDSSDFYGYSGSITTDERVAYYGFAYYYNSQLTFPYYNGPTTTSDAHYFGASFMLDTTAAAPTVTTLGPLVEESGISLQARVNPNSRATSVTFEYSLDATLSSGVTTTTAQNLAAGYVGQSVSSAAITGLPANSTVYVRAVAVNSLGTTVGAIRAFSTSPPVPGYKFSGNATNYQTQYYYDNNWGSYFTTTKACALTHLGVYDHDQNGLGADIPVGIWDSDGTLLGSTTVRSGTTDARIGSFRYRQLDVPVNLAANTRYFVAAYYTSSAPDPIGHEVNLQTDSRIVYEGYTYNYYAGQLSFPGWYTYGSVAASNAQYFGASFLLEAPLPEAPAVTTLEADVDPQTSAAPGAKVWANGLPTQLSFEYSLDASLSTGVSSTPVQNLPAGYDPVTLYAAPVYGLASNSTYYFRAVVTNSLGTAQGAVLSFKTNPSLPGYKYGQFSNYGNDPGYTWGSEFTALADTAVTHLGVYDHEQDGLQGNVDVGLWDSYGNLLASTTVTSDDPLVGTSRYRELDVPVALTANTRYLVAAYYTGNDFYGLGAATTDSRVAYYGYAYNTSYYYGGLRYPQYRGQTGNPEYSYYIGANFLLEAPGSQAPTISTRRGYMRQGSATLNASVMPGLLPTQVTFEYSTDPGLSTGVSTTAAQTVIGYNTKIVASAPIGGLPENSWIYFRAVASNSLGTVQGSILSMKTSGALWNGPPITFAKAPYSDWTQEANQDRLTTSTWLTRASTQGLFNIAQQSGYVQHTSPANTEWAAGTLANFGNLKFDTWYNWWGRNLSVLRGTNAVLHLIDEDIYIDIRFDSWTQASGGGFSYTRSTPGDPVVGSSAEIVVSGNGSGIANGDSTPGTADHTDFDGTPVSNGSVTRTFTLANSGSVDLNLTGASPNLVTLGGANAADFTVTAQPATPVAANGGTTTFQVTFDPSSIGTRTATVSIASDDSTDNPFTFVIQGTGMNSVPTDITLSSSSILENNTAGATVGSLGVVDADAGQTHSFSLVSGTGDTDNGSFSISGSSLNIGVVASYATKSSYSVRVQADDGAGGVFAKVLTVTILPANQAPSFTLNVTAPPAALKGWSSMSYNVSTAPAGLGALLDFSANGVHNLALKADGTVAAWGNNESGQCNVPAGLSNLVDVAAGYDHSLALKGDGTVVAWGSNGGGQCNVPAGLTGVTAISGGGFHSLALKSDGTVVAWGGNQWGQSSVPAGLTGVIAIGAARNHSIALKNDGTVVAWGDNSSGQLNVPAGLTNVTAVSTNTYHNMALKDDGTIVVWGSNNFGERNVPAGLSGVVGIAAGGYHCLVLKSDGTVQAWGADWAGQLSIPADLGLVSRIEAGISHNLVMSEAYPAGFGPVKVAEDSAAYVLNNAAASISAGPPSESSQALTFLVSNDNNALFSVQPALSATGTLSFTPAANASGTALVTVSLKDDGGTANGGVDTSAAQTFTITLTPVNDVPTDITLSPSGIAENNAAGAAVGSLFAADVDAGQTHSFSLVAGSGDTDNGSFSISGTSLNIIGSADYETKSSYSIRVQADDGAGGAFAKALTVIVTDGNDAPVITSNGGLAAAVSLAENTTAVTQVSAVDEDLPAQSISYSLGGVDAALFTVNAGTGVLAFTAAPDYEAPLDQNADNVYQVSIIATDNGSPAASSSQQIAVTVTDVPEFPEITVLGNGSEIVSGASTPSPLNGTDFGNVLLGAALSRSFTISNTDVAPLNFTGAPLVEIAGAHAGNFAVTVMPSAVVAPMTGQTSFTLRFIPTGTGLRTAQVTLRSNDPDEGTYTFAIQGTGYSNNAGRVSFAPAAYVVNQGASQVVLNISRVDGKAATSVRLTTAPGTPAAGYTAGSPGQDYEHQDVIVSFPENATSRQVVIPLIARSGAQPNYQFSASLSNPGERTTLGTSSQATITIKAHVRPTVTVSTPRQSSVVSGLAPYNVTGAVMDGGLSGINRVEVKLNGGAPVNATLAPTRSYNCDVLPVNGLNTLEVTAFDNRGVSSLPVSVTFTFTRHYKLETPVSSLGAVTVVALPASSMSAVPRMSYKTVLPGTAVKMTATSKGSNTVFSHWTGLPADAVVNGNVMSFTMPAQDVLGIVAVFNPNTFKAPSGEGKTFYGVLQPASSSLNSINNLVFLTGTMTDTGAFTGKVLIGGLAKSFSAQFFGNGSSTFGMTKTPTLGISSDRKISLTYVNGNVEATVSTLIGSTVVASGTARRIIYTLSKQIPPSFRNASSAASLGVPDSGYFSLAMPAKVQNPERDLSTYPQGDGIGTIQMSKDGLVTYAGTLADDSKFTASTGLVAGNNAPFLAQITSPGKTTAKAACLAGTLAFNTAPSNSDVTATNLIWIRPAAPLVSLYTAGWPGGIHLDAIGALYNKSRGVYASLSTGLAPANGGVCELYFSAGKLNPDISVTSFSINSLNEVRKVPLTNTSFTLILTPNLAAFNGTFTPNWPGASKLTKPAFKGILLQKGASKGGYGFFISNRMNDADPESGRVTLGLP